jgi:tetratricopeptide (TPR) repeat protein
MHRRQLNLAETHCQRGLTCARLYEGIEEEKADLLCEALNKYYNLRGDEGNYDEALIFAEEAYDCVAVAYNPVHPKVQNAASTLIECLTRKGDFDKAELFAQMTLDSLKDSKNGLDQQSEAVANGYYDLAIAFATQRENFVKAEKLARESLRIRVLIDSNNQQTGNSVSLLSTILRSQGKVGSETKELLEKSLAIDIRNFGPDGLNTAISHNNFGLFYRQLAKVQQTAETKKNYLRLCEIKIKEVLRIFTKIYGPDDPKTLDLSSELPRIARQILEV